MPVLRYEGTHPNVEVVGYGHFGPGDEKNVDEKTACDFEQQPCADEGWVVVREESKRSKKAAETESNDDSQALSPRGPGRPRNHND
jgi:hypothetical protein